MNLLSCPISSQRQQISPQSPIFDEDFQQNKQLSIPQSLQRGSHSPKEKRSLQTEEQKRTSLVVQWLRLQASTAGGVGSIPGQETKIPHAAQSSQKQNKQKPVEKTFVFHPSLLFSIQWYFLIFKKPPCTLVRKGNICVRRGSRLFNVESDKVKCPSPIRFASIP